MKKLKDNDWKVDLDRLDLQYSPEGQTLAKQASTFEKRFEVNFLKVDKNKDRKSIKKE